MKWSPQQDAALLAVDEWLRDPDQQVFKFFGYAGTGKTTMAQHIAEGVDGEVLFGAYTGKAAHVLRQKGCHEASTIHSMIYHTKEKGRLALKELEAELAEVLMEIRSANPEVTKESVDNDRAVMELRHKIELERQSLSRPTFTLNQDSDVAHAELTIIDECSMVDDRMGMDLLSFGTKVLVLGDPAQLPPVRGDGFFITGREPDLVLTEIHRQARDNPIIAMATQVREEQALSLGDYGSSRVVEKCHIDHSDAMAVDQVLVGKNMTRTASNRRIRQILGYEGLLPVPDDRLVCLRNNHERGLLNGAIWYVNGIGDSGDSERVCMTVRPEDEGDPIDVEAHTHYFLQADRTLPWWERKEAEEFDYGYALTVHKAQGSQWNDLMLFDESYCFRRDKWKWLYTGITRAAERITVVRM